MIDEPQNTEETERSPVLPFENITKPSTIERYIGRTGRIVGHVVVTDYGMGGNGALIPLGDNSLEHDKEYRKCKYCNLYMTHVDYWRHVGTAPSGEIITKNDRIPAIPKCSKYPAISTGRAVKVNGQYREVFRDVLETGRPEYGFERMDENGNIYRLIGTKEKLVECRGSSVITGYLDTEKSKSLPQVVPEGMQKIANEWFDKLVADMYSDIRWVEISNKWQGLNLNLTRYDAKMYLKALSTAGVSHPLDILLSELTIKPYAYQHDRYTLWVGFCMCTTMDNIFEVTNKMFENGKVVTSSTVEELNFWNGMELNRLDVQWLDLIKQYDLNEHPLDIYCKRQNLDPVKHKSHLRHLYKLAGRPGDCVMSDKQRVRGAIANLSASIREMFENDKLKDAVCKGVVLKNSSVPDAAIQFWKAIRTVHNHDQLWEDIRKEYALTKHPLTLYLDKHVMHPDINDYHAYVIYTLANQPNMCAFNSHSRAVALRHLAGNIRDWLDRNYPIKAAEQSRDICPDEPLRFWEAYVGGIYRYSIWDELKKTYGLYIHPLRLFMNDNNLSPTLSETDCNTLYVLAGRPDMKVKSDRILLTAATRLAGKVQEWLDKTYPIQITEERKSKEFFFHRIEDNTWRVELNGELLPFDLSGEVGMQPVAPIQFISSDMVITQLRLNVCFTPLIISVDREYNLVDVVWEDADGKVDSFMITEGHPFLSMVKLNVSLDKLV